MYLLDVIGAARFVRTEPGTIKCHILDKVSNPTVTDWTDFSGFTEVDEESLSSDLTLEDDSTIRINTEGLYIFGGCIHVQNNTQSTASDITLLSRILKNGTDESRCSQRGYTKSFAVGSEDILSYVGTLFAYEDDYLRLQYYTDGADLDFYSNSNFQEPVAATIWLFYLGENPSG